VLPLPRRQGDLGRRKQFAKSHRATGSSTINCTGLIRVAAVEELRKCRQNLSLLRVSFLIGLQRRTLLAIVRK
jgi:hypothetical protein